MPEDFVRPSKDGALLRLRVSPGSKRSSVNGLYGEAAVRLSVAAPPVDGKANAEVEKVLSKLLGVSKGDVCVVGGASGRDKTVLVRGAAGAGSDPPRCPPLTVAVRAERP